MFTLKDVRNFFEGTLLSFIDNISHLPTFQKEMVLYRSLLCWECLSNGRCVSCGCSTPSMFFAPNKVDSKGRWGKWDTLVNWNEFKKSPQFKQNLIEAYGSYKGDPKFIEALTRLVGTGFIDSINSTPTTDRNTPNQSTDDTNQPSNSGATERVSIIHVGSSEVATDNT